MRRLRLTSSRPDLQVVDKHEVDPHSLSRVRWLCREKPSEELFELPDRLSAAVRDVHDDYLRIRARVGPVRLVQPLGV